ncbi:sulfotransferase [Paenibacillus flagellatus]|uniref:Sulfotransferase family protein n=1 Tax=Paenibacillus flagellatus TaxID=2211139 RepID=A0A2V5K4B3_9BACL|nr:sulfotransferase [Paenibacillus flagellatus]PYI53562.1 hypothetical protein DLM86_17535 [Paenibacillus flagellatus]
MIRLIISAATGRSGSTLLQRICNARKETLIWGEHYGIIKDFANIYDNLVYFSEQSRNERTAFFDRNKDTGLWTANMTPELPYVEQAVINAVTAALDTLYGQFAEKHDIVGFKEVRYGERELRLLRKCYPDCPFLLLVRHPVPSWASAPTWYRDIDDFAGVWNERAGFYAEYARQDPNSLLIRYEDLVDRDPKTLKRLSEVTKVPVPDMIGVLSKKVGSFNPEPVTKEQREEIVTKCRPVMKTLLYR